jgi:hypothetical protein
MDLKLPLDFKEFLKLLKEHNVRYLLIGGYAITVGKESKNASHEINLRGEFIFKAKMGH